MLQLIIFYIGQCSVHTASQYVIQGILLTFHQLLMNFEKLKPSLSVTKQVLLFFFIRYYIVLVCIYFYYRCTLCASVLLCMVNKTQ